MHPYLAAAAAAHHSYKVFGIGLVIGGLALLAANFMSKSSAKAGSVAFALLVLLVGGLALLGG